MAETDSGPVSGEERMQIMPERRSRVLYVLLPVVLFLGAILFGAAHGSVHAQSTGGTKVHVVFVMDTSGSMNDEFAALCNQIPQIVKAMQDRGVDVQYEILNIHRPVDVNNGKTCTKGFVSDAVGNATATNLEDWGPASDIASGYAWQPGRIRLIITMSDEPPYHGEPCDSQDEQSILQAATAAQANRWHVAPIR